MIKIRLPSQIVHVFHPCERAPALQLHLIKPLGWGLTGSATLFTTRIWTGEEKTGDVLLARDKQQCQAKIQGYHSVPVQPSTPLTVFFSGEIVVVGTKKQPQKPVKKNFLNSHPKMLFVHFFLQIFIVNNLVE